MSAGCKGTDVRRAVWLGVALIFTIVIGFLYSWDMVSRHALASSTSEISLIREQNRAVKAIHFETLVKILPAAEQTRIVALAIKRLDPEDRAEVCARLSAQFLDLHRPICNQRTPS